MKEAGKRKTAGQKRVKAKMSPAQRTRQSRLTAAAILKGAADAARGLTRSRPRLDELPQQRGNDFDVKHPFQAVKPPPGVLPAAKEATFAFDMDPANEIGAWMGGAMINYAYTEGLQFLGYPYLAQLFQRAEYRRPLEIIATDMTRKGFKLKGRGDDDKTDKIQKLEAELKRLDVIGVLKEISIQDGGFGRAHVYLDTGDTENPDELMTDIGNGRSDLSEAKVNKKHPILALRCVEAVWTYPTNYNSANPLTGTWYKPDMWFVMGQQVHASRLLPFIGRAVPDLLKPAYSFGGLALTQIGKPYVTNWLQTRQSINDAVNGFSTFLLSTNMAASLQVGGDETNIARRAALFDELRSNRGLFMIDKNEEDFDNVAMPLSGLDLLQAQAQEHMAAVFGIPLIKLLGISPAGLNASSEGELKAYYDWIKSQQVALYNHNLQRIIDFVQLSLFGETDDEIEFDWAPLWELNETELAEVADKEADTHQKYVDMGAIDPEEVRKVLADDPDSPYNGIDPDKMPDLLEEEIEGLMPQGGKPELQTAVVTGQEAAPGTTAPTAKPKPNDGATANGGAGNAKPKAKPKAASKEDD